MRSGIIKSTYEDTYVFPPPPEYKFLQFGGTGDDIITDIKTLSDGSIICALTTKSTSFLGLDLSSYTNGSSYSAYGIIKIDKNLPSSGFLLASYWCSGASSNSFGHYPNLGKIAIDGSDNIYFIYGTAASAKCYKLNSSLTLTATADTAFAAYERRSYIHILGSYVFCTYTNASAKIEIQKNNVSDLTQVSKTELTAAIWYITGSGIACPGTRTGQCVPGQTSYIIHSATPAFYAVNSISGSGHYEPGSSTYDSLYNYIVSLRDTNTKIYYKAYNEDLTGAKPGFVGDKIIDNSGYLTYLPNITRDEASDKLFITVATNKGAVGAFYDMVMYDIDPSSGSATTQFITYNDGSRVGNASYSYLLTTAAHKYDTLKYLVAGYTNGNLNGFSNSGAMDCIIMKVDNTGKILA